MTPSYEMLLATAGIYMLVAGFSVYAWTQPVDEHSRDSRSALLTNGIIVVLFVQDAVAWASQTYYLMAVTAAVAVVLRIADTYRINRHLNKRSVGMQW